MQATHALYDWIAAQLERFGLEEWNAFNQEQRAEVAGTAGIPWCVACEDWTGTYGGRGRRWCVQCATRVLPERPLIHGFTWKTAFYRGALLRIANRLAAQRKAQQQPLVVPVQHDDVVDGHLLVIGNDEELKLEAQRHTGDPQSRKDPATVPGPHQQPEASAPTLSCPLYATVVRLISAAAGSEPRSLVHLVEPRAP